jgi:hypothetical protein
MFWTIILITMKFGKNCNIAYEKITIYVLYKIHIIFRVLVSYSSNIFTGCKYL